MLKLRTTNRHGGKGMINFTCTKCGSREYITRKGRNHKGLYCLRCGKLDRYLTREKKTEKENKA